MLDESFDGECETLGIEDCDVLVPVDGVYSLVVLAVTQRLYLHYLFLFIIVLRDGGYLVQDDGLSIMLGAV